MLNPSSLPPPPLPRHNVRALQLHYYLLPYLLEFLIHAKKRFLQFMNITKQRCYGLLNDMTQRITAV